MSLGAQSIEVEYKDGREYVIATKGTVGISIATYKSSSADAKELRRNLYAAARKPVRTIIGDKYTFSKSASSIVLANLRSQ
jgi:hypothetical protein